MDEMIEEKITEWLMWDKNVETRAEIERLKDTGAVDQLRKLLLSRLEFGTAGLRGRMGAGYSQMNDLVIIQTSQGFCTYIEETFKDTARKQGLVIGYDGRHHSQRFAELAAGIFVNRGIPVYLYSRLCPTPFVPYALRHFQCVCGIMVTASHNPKEDNGYKVYWENGAQIIPPHDKNIQNLIVQNLVPWEKSWDTSILQKSSLLRDPLKDVEDTYFESLGRNSLFCDINKKTNLTFTYTPMHGVGFQYMVRAFQAVQLKPFIVVEEQRDPDPEFPTVKFPNPEEGKSALNLAIQTAAAHGSTVILANDPDADRLAVAERLENGLWHIFSGNEIGALLGWWCLFCYRKKNACTPVKDLCMLSSTVSSKILRSMADIEGFTFEETLTGFKWMGNKAYELIGKGKTVLFAFEEAIGFMCGTAVLDKDGISAGIHVGELAAYLENNNITLYGQLQSLYVKYGQHISSNSYYLCYEPTVVKDIFERLSHFKGAPNTYPDNIMNGKYRIVAIRDLRSGYDSSEADHKAKLPTSSSSYMVTFTFSNGLVATLRTSGTEPKIKYYAELCSSPHEQDVNKLPTILNEMVGAIIDEFLLPDRNGLTSAP